MKKNSVARTWPSYPFGACVGAGPANSPWDDEKTCGKMARRVVEKARWGPLNVMFVGGYDYSELHNVLFWKYGYNYNNNNYYNITIIQL
jgi:hypothetical protein